MGSITEKDVKSFLDTINLIIPRGLGYGLESLSPGEGKLLQLFYGGKDFSSLSKMYSVSKENLIVAINMACWKLSNFSYLKNLGANVTVIEQLGLYTDLCSNYDFVLCNNPNEALDSLEKRGININLIPSTYVIISYKDSKGRDIKYTSEYAHKLLNRYIVFTLDHEVLVEDATNFNLISFEEAFGTNKREDGSKGYYLRAFGKECFFITSQQRVTLKLAEKFLKLILVKLGIYYELPATKIYQAKDCMSPARISEHTILRGEFAGLKYLQVDGKDFTYTTNVSSNPYNDIIIVQEG